MHKPKRPVYITAAEILVPPSDNLEQFSTNLLSGDYSSLPIQSQNLTDLFYDTIELRLNPDQPHHPSPRDVKSMRSDVVAMCICLGKMLEKYGRQNVFWAEVPLFMSTGPNASGMASEIEDIYELVVQNANASDQERNQNIQSEIHPLFALKGLTNSAQAYAAQLFGFRGHNATYGSTSYGTYLAFWDAVSAIESGEFSRAVVGASNGGGLISQFMNSGMTVSGKKFRESTIATSLILESEPCENACEIKSFYASSSLPQLNPVYKKKIYSEFTHDLSANAIFSGGLCEEAYHDEVQGINLKWEKNFSAYPLLGHTGCASFLLNLALGYNFLRNNSHTTIDCLNADPYERESFVKLGSVQ